MSIFNFYQYVYTVIYVYIVAIFVWSIFRNSSIHDGKHHPFVRQIGYAMIIVPFLLRVLGIK